MELLILVVIQVKHWYVDFFNQTEEEVVKKGIYGNLVGIGHSVKHAIPTALIFMFVMPFTSAILIGFCDFLLHYHIDWAKKNYGNQDLDDKRFWRDLGLDQMAHQLCYIIFVALI